MDAFAGMTYPTSQSTKLCTLDDNLAIPDFEEDYGVDMASPHYDLGTLDKLPLELIGEILKTLDLRTLMDLRYANRRATEIINSIPQYKAIRKHAPNALRGILAIQTGRYITLEHLYEKLCTPECEVCGVAGSFLYLLTCKRACFFCFRKRSEFLPLQQTQAIKSFGIDRKFLKTLPCMRSVPGTYSIRMAKKGRSLLLFDTENVRQATIDLARAVSSNEQYVSWICWGYRWLT